jgi:hypothetical protein
MASHRRGRICFTENPTSSRLQALARQDAIIKKTTLTDIFTLEHFHSTYGDDAVILFLHGEDKGLRPAAAELEDVPAGTTIYAIVRPAQSP